MAMRFRQGRKDYQTHPVSLILREGANNFLKTCLSCQLFQHFGHVQFKFWSLAFIFTKVIPRSVVLETPHILCLFKLTTVHSLVTLLCCFIICFIWQRTGKSYVLFCHFFTNIGHSCPIPPPRGDLCCICVKHYLSLHDQPSVNWKS